MRNFKCSIADMRKQVFAEVARLAYEGGDYRRMEKLPYKIVPGEVGNQRESIFLERAIVGERIRLAMGLPLRPVAEHSLLSDGVEESAIAEKYYDPPLVNIIKYACNGCTPTHYEVTNACQGCLARHCQNACPKGAIAIERGQAHIDQDKCIKCGKCRDACSYHAIIKFTRPCQEACGMNAIGQDEYGHAKIDYDKCVSCGMCLVNCPFGAIVDKGQLFQLIHAIRRGDEVVAVIAPAFWGQFGDNVTPGQIKAAMQQLGFAALEEVAVGADLCAVEEAEEFLRMVPEKQPFMATSCCPAWVKYLENENPKYLKNISTCKSPMEMVGAIFRDKYAEKDAQDGRTTYHIAIMPCTAKKMEAARLEFIHDGRPDVDLVLTTREVIDMMQETGIQLGELELESPDLPFGLGSGAAVIYGTSGGVAEAVVRHCLPDKSKNALREISILGLRGDAPIKEASVTIGDTELKLAVVNGLANAKKLLKEIDEGKKFYHLIEVMTCQGGCVGGAGQPYGLKKSKEKRGDGLHLSDNAAMFKRAERNPVVAQMMAEYGEERCHELLHVSYTSK